MATFVGAEYIIANLLIAMKKNHNRDSISLEEVSSAGVYIQRQSLEKDIDAIFLSSTDQLSVAIFEFEADLEFLEFRKGCNAAGAIFVKQGDREKYFITNNYYMFLPDLSDLIRSEQRIDKVHGIFTYTKKGQNIGIKLVKRLD